jgi:hypothetical protein
VRLIPQRHVAKRPPGASSAGNLQYNLNNIMSPFTAFSIFLFRCFITRKLDFRFDVKKILLHHFVLCGNKKYGFYFGTCLVIDSV